MVSVKCPNKERIDCYQSDCPRPNSLLWLFIMFLILSKHDQINQSILKEISPGISLEGMILKLKLQYFGHLMRRVDSLEKTLMLGEIGAGGEGDNKG